MMLVDSSVWIDFLRCKETPQTAFLKGNLTKRRVVTADLVLAEVLQGTRNERAAIEAQQLLLSATSLVVSDAGLAVEAARNYRHLRAKGITIRSTIDVLIATRCIADGHYLLYSDRDFDPFVEHLGLRSALSPPFGLT